MSSITGLSAARTMNQFLRLIVMSFTPSYSPGLFGLIIQMSWPAEICKPVELGLVSPKAVVLPPLPITAIPPGK